MAENTKQRLDRINKEVTSSVSVFNNIITNHFMNKVLKPELISLQKQLVIELLRRVILKTPVDTGRARGNWQIGVGSIPKSKEDKQAQGDQAEAGEIVASALIKLKALGFGQIVWVSNNLDYILFLEDGGSTQAPEGMLKVSLLELEEIFK